MIPFIQLQEIRNWRRQRPSFCVSSSSQSQILLAHVVPPFTSGQSIIFIICSIAFSVLTKKRKCNLHLIHPRSFNLNQHSTANPSEVAFNPSKIGYFNPALFYQPLNYRGAKTGHESRIQKKTPVSMHNSITSNLCRVGNVFHQNALATLYFSSGV